MTTKYTRSVVDQLESALKSGTRKDFSKLSPEELYQSRKEMKGWLKQLTDFLGISRPDHSRDMSFRKIDYKSYIQSSQWKQRSSEAKAKAGWHCQVCNSTDRLETHHRTYDNLGHENDEDLIVLCHACHELFSKNGHLAP
jgi:5-methylcytosine-specific restriction endonuclease McrA